MESGIETYIMLLRHEMFAENIKTVGKEFIVQVVLRAGGKTSEVEEVLNHPSISMAKNGEYTVQEEDS